MRSIVGISGASGVILGVELLKALQAVPQLETHLLISRNGVKTLQLETSYSPEEVAQNASMAYASDDLTATIASGSFLTSGMVVALCSIHTLAAIENGFTENLLQRAADVCLKEGRKVVLVPREMPLNRIHMRNLLAAAEAGCVIIPPMLTFYYHPQTIKDLINPIIAKVFTQFDMVYPDFPAWVTPQNQS